MSHHEDNSAKREKDSTYSIFESANSEAKNFFAKLPLKSSLRETSHERACSQQNKTVSFQEGQSRNEEDMFVNNRCATTHMDVRESRFIFNNTQDEMRMSMSPFDKSMANYKATKQKLLEADIKRINERKQNLEKMKREREMRNSQIKSLVESQNLSHSQIKKTSSGYSPNMFDFDHNTTDNMNKSPSVIDINIGARNGNVNVNTNRESNNNFIYNSHIGLNDDLESVGINIQKVEAGPSNENRATSQIKRKLDYKDSQYLIEEEKYQLAPSILDESKTYNNKTYDNRQIYNHGGNSKLDSPGYINITNINKNSSSRGYKVETPNKSERSDRTPKMIISIERKNTPSSYYKESPKVTEGEGENETLTYKDIIEDSETIEFLDKYFEDSQNEIKIGKSEL